MTTLKPDENAPKGVKELLEAEREIACPLLLPNPGICPFEENIKIISDSVVRNIENISAMREKLAANSGDISSIKTDIEWLKGKYRYQILAEVGLILSIVISLLILLS